MRVSAFPRQPIVIALLVIDANLRDPL